MVDVQARRERRYEFETKPWKCKARAAGSTGGNYPQDCDWPVCGCDPYADKVIDALEDYGQKPELTLLLTVARILRSRLPEMAPAYQEDDITALDEALLPWAPLDTSDGVDDPDWSPKDDDRRGFEASQGG